ncbi:related to Transgelin [Saccharomycodes ludwigii]|uniref:Related to Transgelin n=1 Tax=Saccharomycodes ludwigii TaxID=36035 RepID=A0A376B6T6_9ASCO|nr:hypothetical protein SCDLUD_004949 [Saccharomycodes ludwigii]KAH3899504.1 hypothetical protein SCDLUD_004949 [Saccharomycodes ludwigii]SSD60362.1 related to Transgelin [Saccharomycodes ludwigii]
MNRQPLSYTPVYVTDVKPDVTSLDEDLKKLRDSKFTQQNIDEIRYWMFNQILKESPSTEENLLDLLKDGTVLCRLANKLIENDSSFNPIKWKCSKIPFIQMEQISLFLQFCKQYGVPEDELFQTVDLFEKKDPAQVYQTIKSLSRYANLKNPSLFPVIGPKLTKKKPPVKHKPDYLSKTTWSTIEYGYMGGSNQTTEHISFGKKRDIV